VFLRNLFVFKFTPVCNNSFIIVSLIDSYPPEEAKVALAENIIKEFPKLRDHETTKGHVRKY